MRLALNLPKSQLGSVSNNCIRLGVDRVLDVCEPLSNKACQIMIRLMVRADLNRFGQILQHCSCTLPITNKAGSAT